MKSRILQILILPLMAARLISGSNELSKEVDLRGEWRFEIGNLKLYSNPDFDDSNWETIDVPGNWERQGFPGYDGYAWYRTRFKISSRLSESALYLELGYVDDVDRVYINGHFLNGSGSLPPNFLTAWDRSRLYTIPNSFLNFHGDNCLAVQVYDNEAEGGIRKGSVGIYSKRQPYHLSFDLSGLWKFMPGDNMDWNRPDYVDEAWHTIEVPGKWEYHGFKDLDGFAWYRKAFVLPNFMKDDRWILVLGRIDDIDEVFFNGTRIGQTGQFPDRTDLFIETGYGKLRLYSIPRSLLRANRINVIAVRVYDKIGEGGIYEGPVGLISRKTYLRKRRYFH
ncbi:beta galactosidase jelly roll domain-containing protein [bacterium]|nr:beta galactosidase jelly roll domain-containing protein [bacterium]